MDQEPQSRRKRARHLTAYIHLFPLTHISYDVFNRHFHNAPSVYSKKGIEHKAYTTMGSETRQEASEMNSTEEPSQWWLTI